MKPSYCPECAAPIHEAVERGLITCPSCHGRWKVQKEKLEGLRKKFVVQDLEKGGVVSAPTFVLVLTDPAARAAARAYAAASRNQQLARDLEALIVSVERTPENYPAPGSEGRLNKGIQSFSMEEEGAAVVVILKSGTIHWDEP